MSTSLRESRDLLRETQRNAVRFMEGRGFCREQIGHLLGYAGRAQVDNVMGSGEDMFGLPQTLILFRFCSEHGYDAPANVFSADGKANVELHVEADGEITDDMQRMMEGAGIGSDLFRKNDPAAMMHFSRAVNGVIGLMAEGGVKFQNGHTLDPCQTRML